LEVAALVVPYHRLPRVVYSAPSYSTLKFFNLDTAKEYSLFMHWGIPSWGIETETFKEYLNAIEEEYNARRRRVQ
jgi:hypothetical protein